MHYTTKELNKFSNSFKHESGISVGTEFKGVG